MKLNLQEPCRISGQLAAARKLLKLTILEERRYRDEATMGGPSQRALVELLPETKYKKQPTTHKAGRNFATRA